MKQISTRYALLLSFIVCTVLHSPVIEAQQKMYWTTPDKIQRADLDGSNVENLVTGLSNSEGIALDLTNGKMYWTGLSTNKIQRADLDGQNVEDLITGLLGSSGPRGIALDLTSNKMYWTARIINKIQRADLDGSNVEDLVTGLSFPRFIALDVLDIPPPVSIDITASPNPAPVGGSLDILLDLENSGDGFDAKFRLWALTNGNVTTLVSLSPFVDDGLVIDDFILFSTDSVPAGLPPTVGFLAAIFNAGNGELLAWDSEFIGIGVAPSPADITALRQAATDFLDSGDVRQVLPATQRGNAAPAPPTQELNFNGTANNPFGQQINSKGKLTTTWGQIKGQ